MAIIGIDLGTTNSLVAQLDTSGTPQIIHNKEGMNITPSFIWFEDSTKKNVKIGIEAKNNFQQEENIYNSFKTFMGSKTR